MTRKKQIATLLSEKLPDYRKDDHSLNIPKLASALGITRQAAYHKLKKNEVSKGWINKLLDLSERSLTTDKNFIALTYNDLRNYTK